MGNYKLTLNPDSSSDQLSYLKLGITEARMKVLDAFAVTTYNRRDLSVSESLQEVVTITDTLEEVAYICYVTGMLMEKALCAERIGNIMTSIANL